LDSSAVLGAFLIKKENMKIKIPLLILFSFLIGLLQAQLVIKVNSIPVNTPAGANIYVAGSFNNWNPASSSHILTPTGNGQYAITVTASAGLVEFKFTRGSWNTVEGNATGSFQANHQFQYNGQQQSTTLPILSWEDLGNGGNGNGSTAASNVSIMDNSFYIPQLNKTRRIWLYLPPDYQTTTKKYPVLYLQDGQNLFDDLTSFSGEWKVDESLNTLFNNGDYGCIVVGIDNGGADRLDEYSPWVNAQYGGGDGGLYTDFIVNTLKPHIDANYRTLPARLYTGIGGSSMGALIATYAMFEHQDVFSKALSFSPAYWFAGNANANHVTSTGKQGSVKIYLLAGGDEPDYVTTDMTAVGDAMLGVGFSPQEIYFDTPSDGQHSEWFWAREFPDAYKWLFQNLVTPTNEITKNSNLEIFPNPATDWIKITQNEVFDSAMLVITGADGKIWQNKTLKNSEKINTSKLPTGFYVLKIMKGSRMLASGKFAKQ
jgi:predicted alpha/beta superfamily hydrolase